jgi:hypothetical protein
VKNGKKVEGAIHQVMKCILSYVNPINVFNPRNKKGNGLIIYYKMWYKYSKETCRCRLFHNCKKD